MKIYTIGHSTRSWEEFLDLLTRHEIKILADVRHFPGSRRYPHFNQERLSKALAEAGIRYEHLPELGGRRKTRPDSPNTVWRNAAFRGYADYMESEAFRKGTNRLLKLAADKPTAFMCAEAVWWRCHRSMIADFLKAKGIEVRHIGASKKTDLHPYTSAARIVDGQLSYRPSSERQTELNLR